MLEISFSFDALDFGFIKAKDYLQMVGLDFEVMTNQGESISLDYDLMVDNFKEAVRNFRSYLAIGNLVH